MKKSKISAKSIGKMLSRADLKLILGGLEDLRPYDPLCDEVKENEYNPDCPCYVSTQCPYRRYMSGPLQGFTIPGSGQCVDGVCT